MILLDYSNYESLYVCGDIHGAFPTLIYNLKRFGIENAVIIVAGDCGIGFERESHYTQLYNFLRKNLENSNNILLLVRGNHDDPTYFDGKRIGFERMKCVKDYSVIRTAGHNVLCIGGAVSVDRSYRLQTMEIEVVRGKSVKPIYWVDEPVIFNESALSEACSIGVDTVVTHTCPTFCYPTSKAGIACYLAQDANLESELTTERALMEKIYDTLVERKQPLQSWYYAHFHQSSIEVINNIKFCLLNIDEIKECTVL